MSLSPSPGAKGFMRWLLIKPDADRCSVEHSNPHCVVLSSSRLLRRIRLRAPSFKNVAPIAAGNYLPARQLNGAHSSFAIRSGAFSKSVSVKVPRRRTAGETPIEHHRLIMGRATSRSADRNWQPLFFCFSPRIPKSIRSEYRQRSSNSHLPVSDRIEDDFKIVLQMRKKSPTPLNHSQVIISLFWRQSLAPD